LRCVRRGARLALRSRPLLVLRRDLLAREPLGTQFALRPRSLLVLRRDLLVREELGARPRRERGLRSAVWLVLPRSGHRLAVRQGFLRTLVGPAHRLAVALRKCELLWRQLDRSTSPLLPRALAALALVNDD